MIRFMKNIIGRRNSFQINNACYTDRCVSQDRSEGPSHLELKKKQEKETRKGSNSHINLGKCTYFCIRKNLFHSFLKLAPSS